VKDSRGFSILLLLLLPIVLIAAVFSVLHIKEPRIVQPKPPSITDFTPINIKTTTNPSDGWQLYTIPEENLKITFPSNWKLKRDSRDTSYYVIVSPNNFCLSFRYGLDGLGGGCDEECQKHNITNIVVETLTFYDSPLNVVVYGLKEDDRGSKAFIAFNVLPRKSCWANTCYGFEGKNTRGTFIITGGYRTDPDKLYQSVDVYMAPEKFIISSDVQTALDILRKISY